MALRFSDFSVYAVLVIADFALRSDLGWHLSALIGKGRVAISLEPAEGGIEELRPER